LYFDGRFYNTCPLATLSNHVTFICARCGFGGEARAPIVGAKCGNCLCACPQNVMIKTDFVRTLHGDHLQNAVCKCGPWKCEKDPFCIHSQAKTAAKLRAVGMSPHSWFQSV
jgi:hypothetical protein